MTAFDASIAFGGSLAIKMESGSRLKPNDNNQV